VRDECVLEAGLDREAEEDARGAEGVFDLALAERRVHRLLERLWSRPG